MTKVLASLSRSSSKEAVLVWCGLRSDVLHVWHMSSIKRMVLTPHMKSSHLPLIHMLLAILVSTKDV
jgi:hypothetical protein